VGGWVNSHSSPYLFFGCGGTLPEGVKSVEPLARVGYDLGEPSVMIANYFLHALALVCAAGWAAGACQEARRPGGAVHAAHPAIARRRAASPMRWTVTAPV